MVEFAIVGPLFFVLVFMILEGALFMNGQATVDNATREGARIAALCGSSTNYTITYQGQSYTGDCFWVTVKTVQSNMGLLRFVTPDVNPLVVVCTVPDNGATPVPSTPPSPPPVPGPYCGTTANSDTTNPCPSANVISNQTGTPAYSGTAAGGTVEVDAYYEYTYYLPTFLGLTGPTTCIISSARDISQS